MSKFNNIKLLVNLFFKDIIRGSIQGKKTTKILIGLLLLFSIGVSLISFSMLGVVLYDSLDAIGQGDYFLSLTLNIFTIFIFITTLFLVPTVMFFSKDIKNILPLPISPFEIVSSKIIVAYLYEVMLTLLVASPFIFAYCIGSQPDLLFYLLLIMTLIVLPIFPILFGTVLIILVMSFSKFFSNQEKFNYLSMGISLIFLFTYLYLVQSSNYISQVELMTLIVAGNNTLANITGVLMPSTYFLIDALLKNNIISLLIGLFITGVACYVFYVISKKFYIRGLLRISISASNKTKLTDSSLNNNTKSNSVLLSYIKKELFILLRTPTYFIQCLVSPFILPFVLFFSMSSTLSDFDQLAGFTTYFQDLTIFVVYAAMVGTVLGLLSSTTNIVSATAISREGNQIGFMKQIPIPFFKQVEYKNLVGIVLCIIEAFILIVPISIFLKIDLIIVIVCLLTAILAAIVGSYVFLLIDIKNPKLIWDSEVYVVKQNFNIVIGMLINFLLMFGGGFVMFSLLPNDNLLVVPMIITIEILLILCCRKLCHNASINFLKK